jgi:hypothetical protein
MVEIIKSLSEIGLPTILAVIVGLFGLIKGVEAIWKWSKGKFLYFYNRKRNKDKLVHDVKNHNNEIQSINDKIDNLVEAIQKRNDIDDKYDRDMARMILLDMYEKFKEQEYITLIQKETYDELYKSYMAKNGNGLFTKTIDPFIQSLEVID